MNVSGQVISVIGQMINAAERNAVLHFNGNHMFFLENDRVKIASIMGANGEANVVDFVDPALQGDDLAAALEQEANYIVANRCFRDNDLGEFLKRHLCRLLGKELVSA